MDTLKILLTNATRWVQENPTDTMYAAGIVGGLALLQALRGTR